MKHFKMSEMKRGYLVGDFIPSAIRTNQVEISIKGASRYTLVAAYYREKDEELICITRGKLDVDGKTYKKGDILYFEPGDVINLFALTDVEMLVIRFPGTKGDLHRIQWNDFDKMSEFYNSYLDKLVTKVEKNCVPKGKRTVSPEDISVVVQGYADPVLTKNTLASIRKYLPGAEIILSTWKECDCTGFDCDLLIQSDDPGACECGLYAETQIPNNGNRQILSTKAGLKKVKTQYAMKMRSDLVLLGSDILEYVSSFPVREDKYVIFSDRLVIGELFTRNDFVYHDMERKLHRIPKPFHPSDWFCFGKTDDLRLMYDSIEQIPREEMAGYKCKYPERVHGNKYKYSWRYTTEQHILLGCMRQKFNVQFDDWTDWNEENIELSRKIMMNNFTILNFCQHKILNQKYIPESYANSGAYYKEKALFTNAEMVNYFENELKQE